MIPIRDTIPSKNYPIVTHVIIGINILCFFIQLSYGQNTQKFLYLYGLVPARYTVPELSGYFSFGQQAFSFLSFMFLHGGFLHLLGNMWSLHIFGDNVEDRMGPFRFLMFYLLCGVLSGLTHMFLNLHSNLPTIGASGAISGVMGAYFILHPTSKILTLVPIVIIPFFFEIPAFVFLGIWFLFQFINAAGSHDISGVAWWAHIGGFIFGIIFLKLFQAFPVTGLSGTIKQLTQKKTSPRFQVIHPSGAIDGSHLYGTIYVTPREAYNGTHKVVNIPWGFHNRFFRVTIPAGVTQESLLRLRGQGKATSQGERGDLYLKVIIRADADSSETG